MIDNSKEYIACAAVWYKNGKHYPFQNVYGIDNGFVIGSFRHPMCMSVCPENPYFQHKLVENGDETLKFEWNEECAGETVQGFITSYGRFVDRKDAFDLALECGQVTRDSILTTQGTDIDAYYGRMSLYSEDIFPKQYYFGTSDGEKVAKIVDLFEEQKPAKEQIRLFEEQVIHNPGIKFPEEVIESELNRLRDSKFETSFDISHDWDGDELSLSEDDFKALCKNIAVYDEDGPITHVMQTEELENWRDNIMFNARGTYSSAEHGKDGTVTLHDIKIDGIGILKQ